MSPRGARPRPVKAAGPVVASLIALLAWEGVAHNSGSGWVQALGGLLAGFALVGLAGPGVATARLRVSVVANPSDAALGRPVPIELRASAPLRVRGMAPHGATVTLGSGAGTLEVTPARRGRLDAVTLAVSSAAPFGLLWWHKAVVVPLARPLWVAPLAGAPDPALVVKVARGAPAGQRRGADARVGEPRGVRPYAPGDPRRLVHWPASAHAGALMVREAERPEEVAPEVVVSLPDDGEAGDAVASRALGTVLALGAGGGAVMLSTREREGGVRAPVFGAAEAGRRLARAVAAPPAP